MHRRLRPSAIGGMAAGGALVAALGATGIRAQEVVDLPAEDRHLDPAFDEVYRVGSVLGEDWEQFGNVRRVAFDAAGQLYVFDNQADRITVVGADGGFRRAFGGPGMGRANSAVRTDSRSCRTDVS